MSVRDTARRERVRAETALRMHLKTCLQCHRWAKGINLETACDLAPQLTAYVELMRKQETLISEPEQMIQDALW